MSSHSKKSPLHSRSSNPVSAQRSVQRAVPQHRPGPGAPVHSQRATPADILTLQRTVGNQVVQRLMTGQAGNDRMPFPNAVPQVDVKCGQSLQRAKGNRTAPNAIQRLVVPTSGSLEHLDCTELTSVHSILLKEPDQRFANSLKEADFSQVGLKENIYFIGHGGQGQIGQRSVDKVAARMATLPAGYQGRIISFNCEAGTKLDALVKSFLGVDSGIDGLAAKLGAQGHKGLQISGPQGPMLMHPELGTKVRTPDETARVRLNTLMGGVAAIEGVQEKIEGTQEMVSKRWRELLSAKLQRNLTPAEVASFKIPVAEIKEYAALAAQATKAGVEKVMREGAEHFYPGNTYEENEGVRTVTS